jgi:hypothetical protein
VSVRIHRLVVRGYRGFAQEQSLEFARPSGQPGSGLTVLVGPNNGGKSSIVELLSFLRDPGGTYLLTEGQRNASAGKRVFCEYRHAAGTARWSPNSASELKWTHEGTSPQAGNVLVIPSRRPLPSQFQARGTTREQYAQQSPDFAGRQSINNMFHNRLFSMDPDSDDFNSLTRSVFEDAPDWHIERGANGSSYLKVAGQAGPHASDGLGDGYANGLQIIDAVFDAPDSSLIVLDEPELSLHPVAARRLAQLLFQAAANKQIVIATHSPYFTPLELLGSGMRLARVAQVDRTSTISQLSGTVGARLSRLALDRKNPHALGIEAREVLFLLDKVILVEGQEDVVGLRHAMREIRAAAWGDFYGWGAGGAEKIPLLCTVLKELGLRKVFVILDGDKRDKLQELNAAFPEYHFTALPTDDIRDKPERQIVGLLTENLDLKIESIKAVTELIGSINQYFIRR